MLTTFTLSLYFLDIEPDRMATVTRWIPLLDIGRAFSLEKKLLGGFVICGKKVFSMDYTLFAC